MTAPRVNVRSVGPLSVLVVLAGWAMAAIAIPRLPPLIPTQFGVDGHVTATGSPESLLVVPIILTVMYVILTAVQFVPAEKLNVPVTITDRNRERVHALARELTQAVRIGALLAVVCVEWATFHAAGRGVVDTAFYVATLGPMLALSAWIGSFIVRMARA
jgi:uncharacterized membrane protein